MCFIYKTLILIFLSFQDLSEGIRQISQFFGFPLTEEQVQTIYSESTFSAMSAKSVHGKMGNVFFRKGKLDDLQPNV